MAISGVDCQLGRRVRGHILALLLRQIEGAIRVVDGRSIRHSILTATWDCQHISKSRA
jgi:hypothetical protein